MAQRLVGLPASPGIVIGPVHLLHWEMPDVPQRIIDDDQVDEEIARFRDTLARARERLRYVHRHAEAHAGPEEAAIFDVQLRLLEDVELIGRVESLISQNLGAEKAFELTMLEMRQRFARATPWHRERLGDITDIQIRVLSLLMGLPDHDPVEVPKGANAILVTHDLTPSLTVQLDREAISGIATDAGTRTSHVAILARSLGLPAVVGLRDATAQLHGGEMAVLDGTIGTLIVEPTAEEVQRFVTRARQEEQAAAELASEAVAEPVTRDGVRLTLLANVDLPEDAERASQSGAEGVGLMRTEFLVVGRTHMPNEEEQYRVYRRVVDAFRGQPVVIRTYDIGGDKLPVGGYATEANPFLGWRAIRVCLDRPELFLPQLRALMRVAVHGDVRVLLPLIVSVDEVTSVRALMAEAARELAASSASYRADLPLGVMIETPAAVMAADTFVGEVDFFSIGTNDLVQYSLAVDRGNAHLASRFTSMHPGVLRMIRHTVEVGTRHGIDVAVCGEMASQPLAALTLIGLGVRELSVTPRSVALIKRLVRRVSCAELRESADAALATRTAAEAEALLTERLAGILPQDVLV
ncbi:MAG TPA: phosphoenolpyruvate--protein phosphotransferase [Gemmatimonadaceae bacterium]|nr:phosphoenolpyruvate--protein phosphotransferase [Gemmatimonadaceae bacterium]